MRYSKKFVDDRQRIYYICIENPVKHNIQFNFAWEVKCDNI